MIENFKLKHSIRQKFSIVFKTPMTIFTYSLWNLKWTNLVVSTTQAECAERTL